MTSEWIRRKKGTRCPICNHLDWCTIYFDGSAACCMRTESAKPMKNGGWLHKLTEPAPMPRRRPKPVPAAPLPSIDWAALADRYRRQADIPTLAADLGVSVESLMRLEAGWDGRCWTFPMRDAGDKIIGIRLRGPEGKLCVKGSRTGIFWPLEVYRNSPQLLFITEGPTDCAAMLSMGFDAIGRPSCLGGAGIITEWMSRNKREVVVMADNDPPHRRPDGTEWRPGWDGAVRLVEQIKQACRSVRLVKPPRHKDIRAWYNAGATAEAVMALVRNQRRIVA
jgi:hypothetical protein